ncbi:hypothetical protein PNK_1457 [Candidatus Protochlamydia naegleriophila]|uniref:Uncharacterized protein n=1 Tax=Candidatus Protochlamydia naegleriophila TaxID=389348 RepID=A0A0U5JD81_9BACT|nr:hypothetical protein [Candidatus Protochlamydia naegleriophila]CUI17069.1 hypothetical protein PNK_1457 [Candidatus Protochlamydia naegleriophila]
MTISFNGIPTADTFTRLYDQKEGLIRLCEEKHVYIGPPGNMNGYEIVNPQGYSQLKAIEGGLFTLTTVEKCQEVIRSTITESSGYELKSYYENPSLDLQKILTLKLADSEIKPTEGECIIAMLLEGYLASFFENNEATEQASAHCKFKAKLIIKN